MKTTSAASVMIVMNKRCKECLLSNAKIVSDKRRDAILEHCNQTGEAFQCHEASIAGVPGICRSFFDDSMSLVVRLAKMLERYEFNELL